jgi:hypothetical protein
MTFSQDDTSFSWCLDRITFWPRYISDSTTFNQITVCQGEWCFVHLSFCTCNALSTWNFASCDFFSAFPIVFHPNEICCQTFSKMNKKKKKLKIFKSSCILISHQMSQGHKFYNLNMLLVSLPIKIYHYSNATWTIQHTTTAIQHKKKYQSK